MNNTKNFDVLLFDVNETLLDITYLEPFFTRVFNDATVLRNWFSELLVYSEAVTISGLYQPFGQLAVGTLNMVAANHQREISEQDLAEFKTLLGNLPPHPDVQPALTRLKAAGFQLATLTNSAPTASPTLLEKAGLSDFFTHQISIDEVGVFKPHPKSYQHAAKVLGVPLSKICLVACHIWDTLGAQAAGCSAAFIARPNNNLLLVDNIPQPDFVAQDVNDFADQIIES